MKIKVRDSLEVAKIHCLNEFLKEHPESNNIKITVLEKDIDRFLILINSNDKHITFDYER